MPRRAALLTVALLAASAVAAAQPGSLSGRVRAPGGVPLKGAQAIIDDSITVVADDSGKFLIAPLAKGVLILRVRAIGFGPVQNLFHVDPGQRVERAFELALNRDTLAAVTIVGERGQRIPMRLQGFEERRIRGAGHSVGAEVLERKGVDFISNAIRFLPGVTTKRGAANSAVAFNTREQCNVNVYLDGNLVSMSGIFDLNMLSPSSVHGIEYYAGGATIPAAYHRIGFDKCGVMLIWSK
jgi:hypothetical protein